MNTYTRILAICNDGVSNSYYTDANGEPVGIVDAVSVANCPSGVQELVYQGVALWERLTELLWALYTAPLPW